MSKRKRRQPSRGPTKRRSHRRTPAPRRPQERGLVQDVAAALDSGGPLGLLALASALLAALDPRRSGPFQKPDSELPSRDELIATFLDVRMEETSALLAAIATLSGDEVLRRRMDGELTARAHPLPGWLADLHQARPVERAVELVHVLGDGDDVFIGARLPGGHELTAVVYIDHNLGTLVKNAFVIPQPLPSVVEHMRVVADDPDTTIRDLDLADARARITEAVTRSAITWPPLESDSWPACRPLLEWMVRMLPDGGTGYQRPQWDDDALDGLAERFLGSPFGTGFVDPEHRGLLGSLLWFGTDYGPGDPMRWSPTAVAILLADWIPRKIVADAGYLAKAPDLLRAFIRFCHHERGLRPALTEQTLAAVDEHEPQYQRTIRTPRPQGPAALLAAMGMPDAADVSAVSQGEPHSHGEIMLDSLRRTVGGEQALDQLDASPLPDEPFAWDPVPADIHQPVGDVLSLVDRCCTEFFSTGFVSTGLFNTGNTEYRTACRRLLSRVAAGDPEIFRRHGRAATAAAAICWIIGKANHAFHPGGLRVKDLAAHLGLTQSSLSQRSAPMLRAVGVDPHRQYGGMYLGSPDYLTSARRAQILADRDRYRAMASRE